MIGVQQIDRVVEVVEETLKVILKLLRKKSGKCRFKILLEFASGIIVNNIPWPVGYRGLIPKIWRNKMNKKLTPTDKYSFFTSFFSKKYQIQGGGAC